MTNFHVGEPLSPSRTIHMLFGGGRILEDGKVVGRALCGSNVETLFNVDVHWDRVTCLKCLVLQVRRAGERDEG